VYVEWAVSGVVSAALGVFVTSLVPFQSLGASSLNMRACPLYSGAVKSSFLSDILCMLALQPRHKA
jgi:hypothetical protein